MGIRLENVSYQDKIKNISYEFEDGKITTVIGSSSSGKTLLSYILSGIIDDYTGNIISTYKNREIGYIFQRPEEAFIFETVKEELAFGIRKYNYRVDEIDKRMEEALKMVGLPKFYLDRNPFTLSSGEKEALALATILILNPKVIIIDDPSISLDNYRCDHLIKLLKKLCNRYKKTIIIFSSNTQFLVRVTDNYVLLKNGKIVLSSNRRNLSDNIGKFKNANVCIPRITEFISNANKKYNANLEYTFDIKELMKDIYRNVK